MNKKKTNIRTQSRWRATLGDHFDCIAAYRNSFEPNDKRKFAPFGRPTVRKNLNISWGNIWVAGASTDREGGRLSFILSIFLRVTLWFITQKSDRIKCVAFSSLTSSASSAKSPEAHFDGPPNWAYVMWVHVTRRDCTFRICMVFLNVTETITIINALGFRAKSHEGRESRISLAREKKSTAGVLYLNNVVRYSASKTRTFAQWLHLLVQQVNSSLEKYDPEKAQKRISFDVEINMDEARRWVREWFALLFY